MAESLWPLGRILEVKPNKRDGLVRSVKLKTKNAFLDCPIDNIILLETLRVQLKIVGLDVRNKLQAVSLLLGKPSRRIQ